MNKKQVQTNEKENKVVVIYCDETGSILGESEKISNPNPRDNKDKTDEDYQKGLEGLARWASGF